MAYPIKEASVNLPRETSLKESPFMDMRDTINNSSLESLKAQNDLFNNPLSEAKANQMDLNRENGALREQKMAEELKLRYPQEEGFNILPQEYLRGKDGEIVKDPLTGEGRRVDFMVEKDGEIVKSIEVTSEFAGKTEQMGKENRIRESGGNYVKPKDSGSLIIFPKNLETEVERIK